MMAPDGAGHGEEGRSLQRWAVALGSSTVLGAAQARVPKSCVQEGASGTGPGLLPFLHQRGGH